MRLRSLSLVSFRNYQKLSFTFGEGHEVFIGKNGAGKTNLIEALSYLSHGKSCLGRPPEDCIRWGDMYFQVSASVLTDHGQEQTLECVFQVEPTRKTAYFLQGRKTPLLPFIGVFPTVTFLPESLDLFRASPSVRRKHLDLLLSQMDPSYARTRLEYDRVLKQRGALLSRISEGFESESSLNIWDETLSILGEGIVESRSNLLQRLMELLPAHGEKLSLGWSQTLLQYERTGIEKGIDLLSALRNARKRDVIIGSTTVGPHRDDWRVIADGRDLESFASRGQERLLFIALLFSSANVLTVLRSERPTILLDDIFSELDPEHQAAVLAELSDHQCIITAPDVPHGLFPNTVRAWRVEESELRALDASAPQKVRGQARQRHRLETGALRD